MSIILFEHTLFHAMIHPDNEKIIPLLERCEPDSILTVITTAIHSAEMGECSDFFDFVPFWKWHPNVIDLDIDDPDFDISDTVSLLYRLHLPSDIIHTIGKHMTFQL